MTFAIAAAEEAVILLYETFRSQLNPSTIKEDTRCSINSPVGTTSKDCPPTIPPNPTRGYDVSLNSNNSLPLQIASTLSPTSSPSTIVVIPLVVDISLINVVLLAPITVFKDDPWGIDAPITCIPTDILLYSPSKTIVSEPSVKVPTAVNWYLPSASWCIAFGFEVLLVGYIIRSIPAASVQTNFT